MTIQQFINQIPFEILQRGQNYYDNGNILELNQGSNGTWYAEVEGNYGNYDIEIEAEDTGRNIYVALMQYLKKMATLKGRLNAAKALKKSLLNKYKNRSTMKEEFKKLNWD